MSPKMKPLLEVTIKKQKRNLYEEHTNLMNFSIGLPNNELFSWVLDKKIYKSSELKKKAFIIGFNETEIRSSTY